jgi:hypothetical protein
MDEDAGCMDVVSVDRAGGQDCLVDLNDGAAGGSGHHRIEVPL